MVIPTFQEDFPIFNNPGLMSPHRFVQRFIIAQVTVEPVSFTILTTIPLISTEFQALAIH